MYFTVGSVWDVFITFFNGEGSSFLLSGPTALCQKKAAAE